MGKKITMLVVVALIVGVAVSRLKWGVKAGGPHRVNLSWKAPAAKPGTTVKTYNVYRSTTSGSQYVKIASSVPEAHYLDTAVSSGKTYYYVVTSVDGAGHESGFSREIKATVP